MNVFNIFVMLRGHALMLLSDKSKNDGKAVITNYYETTDNNIHLYLYFSLRTEKKNDC